MNNNSFINQFVENIKFHYTSFDRVIIRGYILNFFSVACVVRFLKAIGFSRQTNGVMRILTDQLNAHIYYFFYRHVCGTVLDVTIGCSTAVRMWIVPPFMTGKQTPLISRYWIIRSGKSHHRS